MIGILYTENMEERVDWGKVEIALDNRELITIRPVNDKELNIARKLLQKYL